MHKNRGFSLLELSIVLVIIALNTGGIMAGKAWYARRKCAGITARKTR